MGDFLVVTITPSLTLPSFALSKRELDRNKMFSVPCQMCNKAQILGCSVRLMNFNEASLLRGAEVDEAN